VKVGHDRIEKNPDQRVRDALQLRTAVLPKQSRSVQEGVYLENQSLHIEHNHDSSLGLP
jgi:hypothetical protein